MMYCLIFICLFYSCSRFLHLKVVQNSPCSTLVYKDTNEVKLVKDVRGYNRLKVIVDKKRFFFFYGNENINIPLLGISDSVLPCIFFGAGNRLRHGKVGSADIVIGSKDIRITNCSVKTYTIKQIKTNGGGTNATNIHSLTQMKKIVLKPNGWFSFQLVIYAHAGFDTSSCLVIMEDELGREYIQYIDIVSAFDE
jgi:hypothetical protein